MILGDVLKSLRVRLDDEGQPPLWSDNALVDYINDAVNEACVRALLIYDSSAASAVTSLPITAGQAVYHLDSRILQVVRCRFNGTLLCRRQKDQLDSTEGSRWEDRTGPPWAFIEEESTLQLYPVPAGAGTVQMDVRRLPLERLEVDDPDAELEINDQHITRMLEWCLHLAYSKRDSDTEDLQRAARHENLFTAAFGERPSASVQRQRKVKRGQTIDPEW